VRRIQRSCGLCTLLVAGVMAGCQDLRESGDGGPADVASEVAAEGPRTDVAADAGGPDGPAGTDVGAGEVGGGEGGGVAADAAGPGGPPSLNSCQEFLHYARAAQCDDARNIDDWGLRSVAFSPDGQLLAAAGQDAVINLWTVAGVQLTGPRPIASPSFEAIAFSGDGVRLATAGNSGRINVYRVADGQKLYGGGGFEDTLYFTGFAADGDRFFTTTVRAPRVDVWSVSRMSKSSDLTAVSPLRGVAAAAVAPGPWTLLAAGVDGQARFVDLEAPLAPPSPAFTVAMAEDDFRLALSRDGKRLAVASQEGVFLWDVSDRTMPRKAPVALRTWGALEKSWSLAFSPSGEQLAVGVVGSATASVALYAVQPQRLLAEKPLRNWPFALAFSPDGRGLAIGLNACGVLVHCRD
jgi:WD40 repeat protein